jgi:glycosyltransferase involved in cell wall biosynthesis
LKQINDENNIVGLFSFWYGECALLGNRFGKRFGIRHYCWILGQDAKGNNKYVQKIKPKSEELIAISDFVADEFFKNYLIRPLHIIPNGIDKGLFNNTSYERTIDILGVGSLIKLKQLDLFINCIAEVRKDFPEIRSIISGKGPEEKFLSNKIIELNLQDNVVLTGEIQHGEVLKLMQQSRVFLHPSSYEGFSMACLEALYAGCHVISFCKPMNKDFEHWHIVTTMEEMNGKSLEILKLADINHESVIPYSIKETAGSIVKLFE